MNIASDENKIMNIWKRYFQTLIDGILMGKRYGIVIVKRYDMRKKQQKKTNDGEAIQQKVYRFIRILHYLETAFVNDFRCSNIVQRFDI